MQEHPVREWIDTLLHAAVIAKDKQSGPTRNEDEVSSTSATSHMNTVDVTVGVKTADIAISISAADSNAKDVKKEAVDKVESPKSSDAKDVIAISDIDNASSATTTKRYRRRHCEVEGCIKFARFNNACSGHGGRRLCAEIGCERVAQFGHKCSAHGGVKFCSVEGCRRAVQSRGCCKTHGGGVRCQYQDCKKGAISKGFCRSHGGGSRCAQQGCLKWAQRFGFCVRHWRSSSDGDSTRSQPFRVVTEDATRTLLPSTDRQSF